MAAQLIATVDTGILKIRLEGIVSFEDADFRMRDELEGVLDKYATDGGQHILFDMTDAQMAYFSSSANLVFMPINRIQKKCRVAIVHPRNDDLRFLMEVTGVTDLIDCFENERDAVEFLLSDDPMVDFTRRKG